MSLIHGFMADEPRRPRTDHSHICFYCDGLYFCDRLHHYASNAFPECSTRKRGCTLCRSQVVAAIDKLEREYRAALYR